MNNGLEHGQNNLISGEYKYGAYQVLSLEADTNNSDSGLRGEYGHKSQSFKATVCYGAKTSLAKCSQ